MQKGSNTGTDEIGLYIDVFINYTFLSNIDVNTDLI